MDRLYAGLDVHRKETVYCIEAPEGELIAEGSVPTHQDGLKQMVQQHQIPSGTEVALESGAMAWVVCDILEDLGLNPVVIDATEVRKKARRRGQKTDRRDAFEICDGLRRGIWVSRIYMPSQPVRELRRILSRRRHFVRLSTQQINAAKFLLRSEGILTQQRISLTTSSGWNNLLERKETESVRAYLQLHSDTWLLSARQIGTLEKALVQACSPFEEALSWLMSIPGIGLITASSFIAAVGDPARFPDSNHLVSYLGLAPSMYDSGQTERHGHITKAGPPYMRALLCEVAQQTGRPTHPLNPYFQRVCAKSGYKKAAIAIAQRLARIMWRVWINQERFDLNKLNIEPGKTTKTKQYCWRIKTAA